MKAAQRRFYHELETLTEGFRDFGAIPQEFVNTENAMLWMTTLSRKLRISPSLSLRQIPNELITHDLLIKAVDLSVSALGSIDPEQVDDYPAIVLRAANNLSMAFHYIHESYRTEAMLDALIENQVTFDLEEPWMDWVKALLTPQQMDKIAANDFWFAMSVGFERLSWDVVKGLLKTHTAQYQHVASQGLLPYLTRMVTENEWPESRKKFQYQPLKSLADGVTRMMRVGQMTPHYHLFKAYVLSFPVEEVIAAMKAPARQKVLLEMYPVEVLLKHSRDDKALRGKLLELEMGL
jgi:hypothetical protein